MAMVPSANAATIIRVILAVPHVRTRAAIRAALEGTGDIVVVAELGSPLRLAQMARSENANAVVVDLRLIPPGTSPSLADVVASRGDIRVVAVGLDGDPAFARAALRAGADAHVLTDAAPEIYLRAVRGFRPG